MPWALLRNGPHKGLLSALAAVAVHVGAALALPSAPSAPAPQVSQLWLSAVVASEPTPKAAGLSADRAVLAAVSAPVRGARSAPPRAARVRARAQATESRQALAPTAAAEQAGWLAESAQALAYLEGDLSTVPFGDTREEGLAGRPAVSASTSGAPSGRAPGLLATPNPCGGYFPASAKADHGRVRVHVRVDPAGRASVTRVLTELPGGQDFGSAARACAAALRFAPALDGLGIAVPGDAKLELSFHRS